MQSVKIESEHIILPPEVIGKLMGKAIHFIEFQDGFVMKPVIGLNKGTGRFSKLSKLRQRKLIRATLMNWWT